MGFSCMPSLAKVLPKKPPSSSASSWANDSDEDSSKQQEKKQQHEEKGKQRQRGAKEAAEGKSNLDRAALATPYFPFHSRPGVL